jgi:2-phospho-L-lactate guanylyltransferase
MAQAIVPLKDLVAAKTRLSGFLRPGERRALAQAMVEDVLNVLTQHQQIERVTLVSDDPGAGLLSRKYGIDLLEEHLLDCRGLNPVLEKSCDLLSADNSEPLIILHGDMPLLKAADLDQVLRMTAQSDGLVIGCDRRSMGTNLLAFEPDARPRFAFGSNSCEKHRTNASEAGIPVSIVRTMGIGFDVDEPVDLALLVAELAQDSQGQTAKLLLQSELRQRIEMLSNSIENDGSNQVGDGIAL